MNDLTIFKNSVFGEVRTVEENGRPLFCGIDVARALGYARPADAISAHCKGVCVLPTPTSGGIQDMKFIPESDVYRLTFGSKLPTAEKFTDWVTNEILPTIRKTGGYVNDEDAFVRTYLPNVDDNVKALFGQTLAALRSANKKIEEDKPKVLFADAVASAKTSILVGDLAKLIRQNGVEVGQNRLFSWLRANGYLCSKGDMWNMPTQSSMERGLFDIKVSTFINPDGSIRETRTVKVTGKGQNYFVNVFLKKEA